MSDSKPPIQPEAVFAELHNDIPRGGPGDFECTRRAFGMLAGLGRQPSILDVGCGPGVQTLDLAALSDGSITAVDNHEYFLGRLRDVVSRRRTFQACRFRAGARSLGPPQQRPLQRTSRSADAVNQAVAAAEPFRPKLPQDRRAPTGHTAAQACMPRSLLLSSIQWNLACVHRSHFSARRFATFSSSGTVKTRFGV